MLIDGDQQITVSDYGYVMRTTVAEWLRLSTKEGGKPVRVCPICGKNMEVNNGFNERGSQTNR